MIEVRARAPRRCGASPKGTKGKATGLLHRRKKLHGVVGGLGVVAALCAVPGLYPLRLGILAAFAIWILGATLVNLFTEG